MGHGLIVGTTGSGKTNLAKTICRMFKNKGKITLVLDPLEDSEWDCNFKTSDSYEFLQVAKINQECFIFVDESGQSIGRFNEEMNWLATTARHNGHQSIFICQRAVQISPTVRDQCKRMWIFRVSKSDAQILSDEFVQPELANACQLEQFFYYETARFQQPVKRIEKEFKSA